MHLSIRATNIILLDSNEDKSANKVLKWLLRNEAELSFSLFLYKALAISSVIISYLHFIDLQNVRIFVNKNLDILLHILFVIFVYFISVEIIARNIVKNRSFKVLSILAFPYLILHILVLPLAKLIHLINPFKKQNFIIKVFSKSIENNELEELVMNDEELSNEIEIYQNSLEFSNTKVRDCMIPRTEIIGVDLTCSIDELSQKFIETGKSKIIIYKESLDNIIGYVHSFDLFSKPKSIPEILRPISFIPSALFAQELLEIFSTKSQNIAVVVDEYGGTDGLITIEDILEEIFGDIADEYDTEELVEQKISDNEYLFSARLYIESLNEKYQFELPESDEFETLGGLVTHLVEQIPKEKQEISFNNYTFLVEKVSARKVELIKILINKV